MTRRERREAVFPTVVLDARFLTEHVSRSGFFFCAVICLTPGRPLASPRAPLDDGSALLDAVLPMSSLGPFGRG